MENHVRDNCLFPALKTLQLQNRRTTNWPYRQVSNIRRTKSQHLNIFSYCLAAVFAEYLEARCWVENEDIVGPAPTGDAPTTSEWSTILLATKVRLILNVYGSLSETR